MQKHLVESTMIAQLATAQDVYEVFCLYYGLQPGVIVPREDLVAFRLAVKEHSVH